MAEKPTPRIVDDENRRPTLPDLTVQARKAIRQVKIPTSLPKNFNELPRKKQVLSVIEVQDRVDIRELNAFRTRDNNGELELLEYWLEGTHIVYVYVTPAVEKPSFYDPYRPRNRTLIPLSPEKDPVLWKVDLDEIEIHVMYRWEGDKEKTDKPTGYAPKVETPENLPPVILNVDAENDNNEEE